MLLGRYTSKKIPWLQLFIESILVVLSVILALALNNWNENRKNENLADQALQNIKAEIKANITEVSEAYDYNATLIEEMKENPNRGVTLKPANIRDFAWETAQASGAVSHLDYSVISIAAEIHELQEDYRQQLWVSTELIYEANLQGASFFEGREVNFYLNTLYDIHYREKKLLQKYEEALHYIH